MPAEEAKAAVAKLSDDQKQIDLGQKVINRYGCFSCHDIKGFEKTQPIGTDLSEEGSKLVTRLDFGFVSDIPHTSKIGWVYRAPHHPLECGRARGRRHPDNAAGPIFNLTAAEPQRPVPASWGSAPDPHPMKASPGKTARRASSVAARTNFPRRN